MKLYFHPETHYAILSTTNFACSFKVPHNIAPPDVLDWILESRQVFSDIRLPAQTITLNAQPKEE